MDAAAVILSAVSTGFTVLIGLLGWSLARSVRAADDKMEKAEKRIAELAAELGQVKLDHKDAAPAAQLHEIVQAVTRLEEKVQALSQQILQMAKPRRR
jgi:uncharacterized protein Yka (UPF0111/DUF47 family)